MCMGDIKYCSYIYTYIYIYTINVNIVYSRKLHSVMITSGHDSSSYASEEISEKKDGYVFLSTW